MSQREWRNVHNWPEPPCQAISFPSCPQQPRQTDLDCMEGWQRVLPGSARAGTERCARSPGRSPGAPASRSRCSPASSPAGCSWDPPPRNPPRTAPTAGAGADACWPLAAGTRQCRPGPRPGLAALSPPRGGSDPPPGQLSFSCSHAGRESGGDRPGCRQGSLLQLGSPLQVDTVRGTAKR